MICTSWGTSPHAKGNVEAAKGRRHSPLAARPNSTEVLAWGRKPMHTVHNCPVRETSVQQARGMIWPINGGASSDDVSVES